MFLKKVSRKKLKIYIISFYRITIISGLLLAEVGVNLAGVSETPVNVL